MDAQSAVDSFEARLGKAAVLEDVLSRFESVRMNLSTSEHEDAIVDLAERLASWSGAQADAAGAARALVRAAECVIADAEDWDFGVELYERALRRDPLASEPLERVAELLRDRSDWERLESLRITHAEALDEQAVLEVEARHAAWRELGRLRALHLGDLDTAIVAYVDALEIEPGSPAREELAELYLRRAAPGDRDDAAELFFQLGDEADPAQARPFVERALDVNPAHEGALSLLEQLQDLAPIEQGDEQLASRYSAFASQAPAGTKRDSVIYLLGERYSGALGGTEDSQPALAALASRQLPEVAPALADTPIANSLTTAPADSAPIATAPTVAVETVPGSFSGRSATRTLSGFALAPSPLPPSAKHRRCGRGAAVSTDPADSVTDTLAIPRTRGWWWGAAAILSIGCVLAWVLPGRRAPAAPVEADAPKAVGAAKPPGALPPGPPQAPALSKAPAARPVPAPPMEARVWLVPRLLRVRGARMDWLEIAQQLEGVQDALRRCYREALTRSPALEGRLRYTWVVRWDGSTAQARSRRGSLRDGEVDACGLAALEQSSFPRPGRGGAARVRAVFELTP